MSLSFGGYSTWQCPTCQRVTQREPLDSDVVLHCQAPAIDSAPSEQLCGRRLTRITIVTMYGTNAEGPSGTLTR